MDTVSVVVVVSRFYAPMRGVAKNKQKESAK